MRIKSVEWISTHSIGMLQEAKDIETNNSLKTILSLTQCGNNADAFLRDTIAPLVTSETEVYKQLEADIFGGIHNEK